MCWLQEDASLELEDTSQLLEVKNHHLFDRVLVNEDLQPQWTPVSWSQKAG